MGGDPSVPVTFTAGICGAVGWGSINWSLRGSQECGVLGWMPLMAGNSDPNCQFVILVDHQGIDKHLVEFDVNILTHSYNITLNLLQEMSPL